MGRRGFTTLLGLCLWVGCGDAQEDDAQSDGESTGTTASTPASTTTGTASGASGEAPASTSTDSGAGDTTTGGASDGSSSSGEQTPSGCSGPAVEPGEQLGLSVDVDGVTRNYNLFVPTRYDGTVETPLVLNFHGFGSNAIQQAFFSDFNVEAEARGLLVAYPDGQANSWNAGGCCGEAVDAGVDDVAFARALVEQAAATLCVDTRRVYATGMSNGGFMSHRLGCEAADAFAAIGPVAGALVLPPDDCAPTRPVPVIHFHGTDDATVPYGGNAAGFPAVEASLAGWAERNGCDSTSSVTFEMDDVSCQTWEGCEEDATVTLCTLDGFGHCWPGQPFCPSGTSSETIRANTMMLDLFEQHALP
ncbi:MAG: PHB depolymerase family esterase [Myxococcota bacterium]